MRRAALVLGPFTLLAGAVFACESDTEGTGGPQFSLDGSTPAFDGGQQPFDSGAPDTNTPDAPLGPPSVTVTVTGRSGPTAGVKVVFHDASGAVLETKSTDATGKARSTSAALPAMASALLPSEWGRQIVTWTALENGDDLAVREPDREDAQLGRYEVTLPGLFDDAGAQRWDVFASDCWGNREATVALIDLYPWCVQRNTSAVLARAYDGENQLIGHAFKKGMPVPTDGGTTAVATGQWSPPTTVTVTATNAPQRSIDVELLEIADGHGYTDGSSRSLVNGAATFTTATGFAEALQASLHLTTPSGAPQTLTRRVPPGATIAFDAAQVLPAIESADFADGSTARRPIIQWSASSTAEADGGLVRLQFWGRQEQRYIWTFVVPPGSNKVSAPALPPDADEFLPEEDAGLQWALPELVFIEADVILSYKAFRSVQGTLAPADMPLVYGFPALPQNGTYRSSGWAPAL